jgi:hypothetical protein
MLGVGMHPARVAKLPACKHRFANVLPVSVTVMTTCLPRLCSCSVAVPVAVGCCCSRLHADSASDLALKYMLVSQEVVQ